MREKVTDRRSKEHRFREIEAHLQNAGEGGLRVAGVANAIGKSKSYAHKLLLEMVDLDLIERRITYTDTDTFLVNYVYFQLPLWGDMDVVKEYEGAESRCWVCDAVITHDGDRCSGCEGA